MTGNNYKKGLIAGVGTFIILNFSFVALAGVLVLFVNRETIFDFINWIVTIISFFIFVYFTFIDTED